MPRYDLLHWSQRVRDQQAQNAGAAPQVSDPPVRQTAKQRTVRPKPPRDEDAEHLLRLCRDGRLFEIQAWVAAGRPLTVPSHYRQTPLRVAVDTGFHSLVEYLLQHETTQAAKDGVVEQAWCKGQYDVMRLAVQHGATVSAVSFQDVVETWDRSLAEFFLEQGADPITNSPFARAFKQRIKGVLGIFLDCKRARPDLTDGLQEQADMALRQACTEDDLKWVSLLMWLGADPRTKGLATDDLDTPDAQSNPEYQQSGLQIACGSRNPEILKRLKPDPHVDDLRELMAAVRSLVTPPETLAYLVALGAEVNDKADGGSTVLDTCLRNFAWAESILDEPYPAYRHAPVSVSRLGKSLDGLRFLLGKGARWTPDERTIADARRALYRVDGEGIATVMNLLRTHGACDEAVLKALAGTAKMRSLLAAADRSRDGAQRPKKPSRTR